MKLKLNRVTSLEQVRSANDIHNFIGDVALFGGETYSYQIIAQSDMRTIIETKVDCPFDVKVYAVDNAVVDYPYIKADIDGGYLTYDEGLMPDILTPVEFKNNSVVSGNGIHNFWIEVTVPKDTPAGKVQLKINFTARDFKNEIVAEETDVLNITVKEKNLPKQSLVFTQWLHTDCIAAVHNCEVYGEKHWEYIDKYIKSAVELGINMIYTPVVTPPLDTLFGNERLNVQLVKVTCSGGVYDFDFSLLKRWLEICVKNGVEYIEISHLFSQGGAKYSPNIYANVNGKEERIFGWDINADDLRYKKFLEQLLPKLVEAVKEFYPEDKIYFHISDEPTDEHLQAYEYAYSAVKPYIGNCHTFDALSHYDFYKNGLVEIPVCNTLSIEPFIENKVESLWAYYCCGGYLISNRFLAMPAYRNRVIGLQVYKFGIKGFLHWGFNYYYGCGSLYTIDPYTTTSCDKGFPSGDPFSVYPHKNGPLKSMRAVVFREALQDICICRMLEGKIGREEVVKMIDTFAGGELTFKKFPAEVMYVPNLIEKMKEML